MTEETNVVAEKARRQQHYVLWLPGGERVLWRTYGSVGMSTVIEARGRRWQVTGFYGYHEGTQPDPQPVSVAEPRVYDADDADDHRVVPEAGLDEPAEPPWPGQRFYVARGEGRVELEELRNAEHALPVKVGTPIVLGKRRYTVSAVEDDSETVLLVPA